MKAKRVKDFPDYKVREDGKVASFKFGKIRVLKTNVLKGGHLQVRLYGDGKRRDVLVHHLVLESFVGPQPPGLECRHLDGNPTNNQLENLVWGTRLENMHDKIKHGRGNQGEQNTKATLTERIVLKLRKQKQRGVPVGWRQRMADKYGVTIGTIDHVINRYTWRHI